MVKVLKFGGSSVATIEKIKEIASYLENRVQQQEKLVVVVSAMGKTTNQLIEMAHSISMNPSLRELDRLLSIGEQQTISLLTMALINLGLNAISLTGYQAGIKTSGKHTKSIIQSIDTTRLEELLKTHDVICVAGFQGMNDLQDITTLGRGGSDTTAVALAAALECDCEIYTDVDGVYTTDPRVYKDAKKISHITYEEMMEMSALGSKIMEVRSVELGNKYGVTIYVGKTLSDQRGTYIMKKNDMMEEKVLSAVSVLDNIIQVKLEGVHRNSVFIADIFKIISSHQVNIDMISEVFLEDETRLGFTCSQEEQAFLNEAIEEVKEKYPNIKISQNRKLSKVSVVGIGMKNAVGIASNLFSIFSELNVPLYQVSTSEISISYLVEKEHVSKVVSEICKKYDL
ncbi:MAG: aspartate kinase [Erysipelotrichaceae bacterium]|nr:aspartate kinase [Erysipelotrichaceae bacterium]